jgi:poly-beta-1,6-N-acetyl-D-glucosamine synthase
MHILTHELIHICENFLVDVTIVQAILSTFFPLLHLVVSSTATTKPKRNITQPATETGVSILVPCYNEESILATCIQGMSRLAYSNYEVIFINDGSTDRTFEVMKKLLDIVPVQRASLGQLRHQSIVGVYQSVKYRNMFVIDKVNGGKADALNAGTEFASKPLVVTLDADSILKPDALAIVNSVFEDPNVIAAGGTVRVMQACERNRQRMKQIVHFQMIEYMKSFNILKASLARFNALSIISGAFGIFKRDVMLQVGGFRNTVGEDIDMTMRFQKYIMEHPRKRLVNVPDAICYTECPENWRDLIKQRIRWQKAFIDCVFEYKSLLVTKPLKPLTIFFMIDGFFTGTVSVFTLIMYSFISLLVSVPSQWELSIFEFLIGSTLMNIVWGCVALLIDYRLGIRYTISDYLRIIATMLMEIVFYRFFIMTMTLIGTVDYFFHRHSWNKVERTGRVYDLSA